MEANEHRVARAEVYQPPTDKDIWNKVEGRKLVMVTSKVVSNLYRTYDDIQCHEAPRDLFRCPS